MPTFDQEPAGNASPSAIDERQTPPHEPSRVGTSWASFTLTALEQKLCGRRQ